MDDGRIGDEMTLEGIAKRLDALSSQIGGEFGSLRADFKSHGEKLESLDVRIQSLDGKFTALDHKMTIEFEETRRVVNLGFESTQMLREEVGRRFDDTDRAHADHKLLLESAIVRLRRDMKRPRPPGRRR